MVEYTTRFVRRNSAGEHLVDILRDGEKVNQVVIVTTSSRSAYFNDPLPSPNRDAG